MKALETYPVDELKLVYRLLHAQLTTHLELLEGDFLHDLQGYLQQQARAAGVDLSDHGQWDAWLGNSYVSCEERMKGRETLR